MMALHSQGRLSCRALSGNLVGIFRCLQVQLPGLRRCPVEQNRGAHLMGSGRNGGLMCSPVHGPGQWTGRD